MSDKISFLTLALAKKYTDTKTSHNMGFYATEAALVAAHPTGTDGDNAIVGETDTVWVWDSDTSAWKDSGVASSSAAIKSGTVTVEDAGTFYYTYTGDTDPGTINISGNDGDNDWTYPLPFAVYVAFITGGAVGSDAQNYAFLAALIATPVLSLLTADPTSGAFQCLYHNVSASLDTENGSLSGVYQSDELSSAVILYSISGSSATLDRAAVTPWGGTAPEIKSGMYVSTLMDADLYYEYIGDTDPATQTVTGSDGDMTVVEALYVLILTGTIGTDAQNYIALQAVKNYPILSVISKSSSNLASDLTAISIKVSALEAKINANCQLDYHSYYVDTVWNISGTNATFSCLNKIKIGSDIIFSQTADKALTCDGTAQSLIGTGRGSVTIPANSLSAGDILHISMSGILTAGSSDNLTVTLKIGGVTLYTYTGAAGTTLSDTPYCDTGKIVVRSTGSTASLQIAGTRNIFDAVGFGTAQTLPIRGSATVDTTAAMTVEIEFTAPSGALITSETFRITKSRV